MRLKNRYSVHPNSLFVYLILILCFHQVEALEFEKEELNKLMVTAKEWEFRTNKHHDAVGEKKTIHRTLHRNGGGYVEEVPVETVPHVSSRKEAVDYVNVSSSVPRMASDVKAAQAIGVDPLTSKMPNQTPGRYDPTRHQRMNDASLGSSGSQGVNAGLGLAPKQTAAESNNMQGNDAADNFFKRDDVRNAGGYYRNEASQPASSFTSEEQINYSMWTSSPLPKGAKSSHIDLKEENKDVSASYIGYVSGSQSFNQTMRSSVTADTIADIYFNESKDDHRSTSLGSDYYSPADRGSSDKFAANGTASSAYVRASQGATPNKNTISPHQTLRNQQLSAATTPSPAASPSPAQDVKNMNTSNNNMPSSPSPSTQQQRGSTVKYRNGTIKEVLPDGTVEVRFTNGDIKRTLNGRVDYYYAQAQTTHTTLPDGVEVYKFPNNQVLHIKSSLMPQVNNYLFYRLKSTFQMVKKKFFSLTRRKSLFIQTARRLAIHADFIVILYLFNSSYPIRKACFQMEL